MPRPPTRSSENALVLDNVVPAGPAGQPPAAPINLTIRKGEIFGIAGVAGNGQSELIACLTGLKTIERGAVRILGKDMTGRPPRAFIELGVAHIPEQRREIGIVEPMFVAENVVLKDYRTAPFSRRGVLNTREITRHTEDIVSRFNALVPDLWTTESRILSGGNIQRLILGRETWRSPPVIVASHPTEGLDARAIRHTWELFLELRASGSAILVVSEDLDEIMSLADRIGVLFQGQLMGPVDGQSADREQLGRWMAGSDEAHVAA
jgi:simple sugar transport system ATP-binding protein